MAGKQRPPRGLNRQTIVLIVIIVVALLAGGLAGAELYARHRADSVLMEVAQCVVAGRRHHLVRRESAVPVAAHHRPLHQYLGHHRGERVQSADGMTADVTLADVRLQDSGELQGHHRIAERDAQLEVRGHQGHLAANLARRGQPGHRREHRPGGGHVILDAGDNSVTAKPVVTDGDLNLEVLDVNGPLPKDAVQTALNDLTKKLNDNYPLGIHADSVEVTDSGVVGKFSSQNASIPKEDANPCFARL